MHVQVHAWRLESAPDHADASDHGDGPRTVTSPGVKAVLGHSVLDWVQQSLYIAGFLDLRVKFPLQFVLTKFVVFWTMLSLCGKEK